MGRFLGRDPLYRSAYDRGGMTGGTVPLSAMYSQALGVEAADVLTKMAPATVLGNCVAIIFGGLLNNFGKNTRRRRKRCIGE